MRVLVLSGGGANGAFQARVVQNLYKAGHRWDVIFGTSVGALNGAFISKLGVGETMRVWSMPFGLRDVMESNLFSAWPWKLSGLFNMGPLRKNLSEWINHTSEEETPSYAVYCDYYTGEVVAKSQHNCSSYEEYLDCLIASSSVPIIHEPISGRYLDGGVREFIPIRTAARVLGGLRGHELTVVSTAPVKNPMSQWKPFSIIPILSIFWRSFLMAVEEVGSEEASWAMGFESCLFISPEKTLGSSLDYSYSRRQKQFEMADSVSESAISRAIGGKLDSTHGELEYDVSTH